jgi:acetyl esterase/lipase
MLDYEELRIWQSEFLLTENTKREDSILTSIWDFSANVVFGILDLRNGIKRPNWTLEFQLTIHCIKKYLQQENQSLSRARYRLEMLKEWIPVSDDFILDNLTIMVSFQELIMFESMSKSKNWIIPQETPVTNYSIKGEFLKLKKLTGDRKVILYLHGGAYVLGSPAAFRRLATKLAKESNTDVFVLDYRLAPEFPFPAALHDVLAAYLWLLNPGNSMFSQNGEERYSYKPENIYLGGDSAGGGLVMCFLNYLNHYMRSQNRRSLVPMPGAAFMFSPWSDLSMSSNSIRTNAEIDYLPKHMVDLHSPLYPGVDHPVYSYILGQDKNRKLPIIGNDNYNTSNVDLYRSEHEPKKLVEKYVYHPLISPVFESDFSCLPPILIQSGECEMLRDETITLAYKISKSNRGEDGTQSKVRHELYKDMIHIFQAISTVKSSQIAIKNVANFLDHASLKGHLDDLSTAESDFFIVNSYTE